MDSTEFLQARERLGLSRADVAADFGLTPDLVLEIERGSIKVSQRIARALEWRIAASERDAAMEASGLPMCAWLQEWEDDPVRLARAPSAKELRAVERHTQACSTCQARIAYAERLPPLPPYPAGGVAGIIQWVGGHIMRLPEWARPAATGASLFAAYTLVKGGLTLLFQPSLRTLLTVGLAMILSPTLGAVCGLVYSAFRRIRRRQSPA